MKINIVFHTILAKSQKSLVISGFYFGYSSGFLICIFFSKYFSDFYCMKHPDFFCSRNGKKPGFFFFFFWLMCLYVNKLLSDWQNISFLPLLHFATKAEKVRNKNVKNTYECLSLMKLRNLWNTPHKCEVSLQYEYVSGVSIDLADRKTFHTPDKVALFWIWSCCCSTKVVLNLNFPLFFAEPGMFSISIVYFLKVVAD